MISIEKYTSRFSITVLAFLLICSASLWTELPGKETPNLLRDTAYGFSMSPPAFSCDPGMGMIVHSVFYAPREDGFSANLNIQIQNTPMTLKEYIEVSRAQFSASGIQVKSEKTGKLQGLDTVRWDCTGDMGGHRLYFITQAIFQHERVLLVTGTFLESKYEKYFKVFDQTIQSFDVEKIGRTGLQNDSSAGEKK